ncbi:MAG: Gfo/Idh/MocA family oxidoreductase [Pseudomonadota bacterium]
MPKTARDPNVPVRIGLVGFGRLAQDYYVPALQSIAGAEVVGVVDPLEASLTQARILLPGTSAHTALDAWLQMDAVDALIVSSPPSHHLSAWRSASAHKLPVLMEKPFPLPNELSELREDEPWARLMVNFNRRFWPGYEQLRNWIQKGACGDFESATIRLITDAKKWSTVTQHRFEPGEGGALCDLGFQVADLTMHLFGQAVVSVRAERANDSDILHLEFGLENGSAVHCEVGYADTNCEAVVIRGSERVLRSDNPNYMVWMDRPERAMKGLKRVGDFMALATRGFFRSRSMLRFTVKAAIESFVD